MPEIFPEGVTPDAALEYWRQKARLTDAEASTLSEGARARAFYVSGLARRDLVELVADGIRQALENGETLAEFKSRIADAINTQGWHSHRVENIFRTNLQQAYAAGRYKKMQAVKKSRPYWQYIAVMDRRVRPSHAVLHELVYPADHGFWASNYPPNGFRCRCTVRTLSERQVEREGLSVEKDMPGSGMWTDPKTGMEYHVQFPGADRGFATNPGKDWLDGLDLGKYPELRKSTHAEQRDIQPIEPKAVKTDAELAAQIEQSTANLFGKAKITQLAIVDESYFFATDSKGKLMVSNRTFPDHDNYNPAKHLKSAWNKLATRQALTFNEEAAIEGVWHEIIHNTQKDGILTTGDVRGRRAMEIITEWTARKTYKVYLESLGGKAAHYRQIQASGYGYQDWIINFEKMLTKLSIDRTAFYRECDRLVRDVSVADYDDELKEWLAKQSGMKHLQVSWLVEKLDESLEDYEKTLAGF